MRLGMQVNRQLCEIFSLPKIVINESTLMRIDMFTEINEETNAQFEQ